MAPGSGSESWGSATQHAGSKERQERGEGDGGREEGEEGGMGERGVGEMDRDGEAGEEVRGGIKRR